MTTPAKPAVHIVGWSHSKFGKYDQLEPETLIADAVRGALADAGLSAEQVDAMVVGTFNGGFVGQDFPSSLALNAEPGASFQAFAARGKRLRHRLGRHLHRHAGDSRR